ncbi:MAG TPA: hypothetical protein GXX49_11655 [Clostridiaceae bacterium]|nr:hypothetical protein [Clostridiaceae bacterium]
MKLLEDNKFIDIEIEEFNDAFIYFPSETEFAKYLPAMPGNPDYTLPENKEELDRQIQENKINGRLGIKEWRYIWKARKP